MTSAWTEPVTIGVAAVVSLDHTAGVETMLEAIDRLRALGHVLDLRAAPAGRLVCSACRSRVDAGAVQVDATVRFEGDSNPADESILVAITLPCGHRGLSSAAFGSAAPALDVEVLQALAGR